MCRRQNQRRPARRGNKAKYRIALTEKVFARNETIAPIAADRMRADQEASAMRSYRIYKLNPAGRIVTGTDAMCASDEAALMCAASIFGPQARAEIWHRDRRVGHLGAPAGVPSASPFAGPRDRETPAI